MNHKKMCAFIFGLIPMTLIQHYYWNWMVKYWTNEIDFAYPDLDIIIPVIITLIYCFYEKYIVFSMIFDDTVFRDRIPLAVFWILEGVIGTMVSCEKVSRYEKQFSGTWNIGFGVPACSFAGAGMIVSFLIFRGFLYREKERL